MNILSNRYFHCILLSLHCILLNAQIECIPSVSFSIPTWACQHYFVEGDLSTHEFESDSFTATPSSVSSDDYGKTILVSCEFINNGDVTNCDVEVKVMYQEPIISFIHDQIFYLDENHELDITLDMVDGGSFHPCFSYSLEIWPTSLTCEDAGDVKIWMRVNLEDGNYVETWKFYEVIDLHEDFMECIDTTISLELDEVYELNPFDYVSVLEPCGSKLTYYLTNEDGEELPTKIITSAFSGYTVYAHIVNQNDLECVSKIVVQGDEDQVFKVCDTLCWTTLSGDCESGHTLEDNVEWPCDITLKVFGAKPGYFTPHLLNNLYGVNQMDATARVINGSIGLYELNFIDEIEFLSNDETSFIIYRSWQLSDVLGGDDYFYLQTISNFAMPFSICDLKARGTDVIDCEFGHTLEDDVEWPNDLEIESIKLEPEELIQFSNIDPLDAEPSFYADEENYRSFFLDTKVDDTSSKLIYERTWLVFNIQDASNQWSYRQKIIVDTTSFESRTSVFTQTGRPLPGVDLGHGHITNNDGFGFPHYFDIINPTKEDILYNGVNVRDIVLMRLHILGIQNLKFEQILAADANDNGNITTLDIVLNIKAIIGSPLSNQNSEWRFIPVDDEFLPEFFNHFLALKPGDVDDNAFINQPIVFPSKENIQFDDIQLIANIPFTIPFYLSESISLKGIEMHINYDSSLLSFGDVTQTLFTNGLTYFDDNGQLSVLSFDQSDGITTVEGGSDNPIFTLTITPKENVLLSEAMSLSLDRPSFLLDDELELYLVGGEPNDEFVSGLDEDVNVHNTFNVYPNPSTDIIHIETQKSLSDDSTIQIHDISGREVLCIPFDSEIKVDFLKSGLYLLTIHDENHLYRKTIQVVK